MRIGDLLRGPSSRLEPVTGETGSSSGSSPGSAAPLPLFQFLPLALGLAVAIALLTGALGIRPFGDEILYLEQAGTLRRFGVHLGRWAPAYAFFIAQCADLFGGDGSTAAKVIQVAAWPVVGMSVWLLARTALSSRSALVAGLLWSAYLPLAAFTHLLWPETLFLVLYLPSLLIVLQYGTGNGTGAGAGWWGSALAVAGALSGLSILVKESGLLLPIPLVGWILWSSWTRGRPAIGHAALYLLSVVVVVLPWTLRNWDVYHRFVPVGVNLGVNCYQGWNAPYVNFDYWGDDIDRAYPRQGWVFQTFMASEAEAWAPSDLPNLADRDRENLRRGIGFVLAHPLDIARTRVMKAADYVSPVSFLGRHLRLRLYRGPMGRPGVRRLLVLIAVLEVPLLILAAWAGAVAFPGSPRSLVFFSMVILFFAGPTLLVSMSRFRAPIEPLLMVLAAGLAGDGWRRLVNDRRRTAVFGTGALCLAFLWVLALPGVLFMVRSAW